MNSITVSKTIAAPQQSVWDVLADFGNIAAWNSGVSASFLTDGDDSVSVGSQRHCDLKPVGALEETLIAMEAPQRLVVRIDRASRLPIKSAEIEFLLSHDDAGTLTTVNYRFEANGGPLAGVMGKILEGQLETGFTGFLDDLDLAARAVTPSS